MRIGTTFILDVSLDELVRQAAVAESAGFDTVWFGDAPLTPAKYPAEFKVVMDPFVAMGAVLATTRLAVGTGVLLLPHRDPIATAKAIAYAQHASGGRVKLGVGLGWRREEYSYFGIDKATRGRRFDDALDAMDALFAGVADFHNTHYGWTGADPLPRIDPPPCYIGGTSRAAMERALRRNAAWLPTPLAMPDFDDLAREYVERGGTRLAVRVRVAADEAPQMTLAGSQVADVLSSWQQLGVGELSLVFGRDVDVHRHNQDWFAAEVLPTLHGSSPSTGS